MAFSFCQNNLPNSKKSLILSIDADLAQLVEQLSCKQQVVGPNPTVGSMKKSPDSSESGLLANKL